MNGSAVTLSGLAYFIPHRLESPARARRFLGTAKGDIMTSRTTPTNLCVDPRLREELLSFYLETATGPELADWRANGGSVSARIPSTWQCRRKSSPNRRKTT